MSVKDMSALVTGASEGIGFAIAAALTRGGARVVMVARREDKLAAAAQELGPAASYVAADVGEPGAAGRILAEVNRRHDGLDLLVNNAGVLLPGMIAQLSMDDVRAMVSLNLLGAIEITQAAVPLMAHRPGASIVNISSTSGRVPMAGLGAYGATKAALDQLTRVWALELAPLGIRVNCVRPGPIDTPAMHTAAKLIPGLVETNIGWTMLGRLGTADETARSALHLLDPEQSPFTTGAILDVDGGFLLARAGR